MLEILLAGGIFAALACTAIISQQNGWFGLLQIGCVTLGAGTLLSVLTGAVYHWRLSRTAACRAGRIARWWWTPTRLHKLMTHEERLMVLPWFWAGATSFCLVVLGAVWAVLAVSRMNV